MKNIFKEWKSTIFGMVVIIAVGIFLRLHDLTSFPIFADEAIYIRWAQVMRAESTLRFLPLSDGKQPLFMWIVMVSLKLFSDPLFAGRIVSVSAGLAVLAGVFGLSYILFKNKVVALMASLFYAISPYSVFFDRMALVDSLLSMFGVWTLIFSILAIKLKRFDFAMLAGFTLGGALLTKSPALFFLILLPFTALSGNWPKKFKDKKYYSAKIVVLWIVIGIIGYAIYNVLRLGPNFHLIASRNLDYVYPYGHLFTRPLDPLLPYLDRSLEWLELLGPSLLILLAVVGIVRTLKWKPKAIVLLLIWTLVPVVVSAEFAKVFTARYIFYVIPLLMILAGAAFFDIKNFWYRNILFLLTFVYISQALTANYQIYTDPVNSPLPPNEKSGFLEEWSSGTGIKEASEIIKNMAYQNPKRHIVVGTEGSFGTLPDGLQIYLEKIPNITVIGVGLDISEIPESLIASKKSGNLTYLVANSSRLRFEKDNFEKYGLSVIYSIKKAKRRENTHEYSGSGPQDTFYLFELNNIVK